MTSPTSYRGGEGDEAAAKTFVPHVKAIQRIRPRIEKTFGTWKPGSGRRRMRRRGLAKVPIS